MKALSATVLTYLQSRDGTVAKSMLWVRARNRTTGDEVAVGLWTGDADRDFTIGGATRTYAGEGAMLPMDPIVQRAGVDVRLQRVILNPLDPTVAYLTRTLDLGLAPVELHRALFDPATGVLIEEPHRVWKGFVDSAPITTPEIGGASMVELTLASAARQLQRGLTLTKSDAVQTLRAGDRFRRFQDVSGSVKVWWGASRSGGPATPPRPYVPPRGSDR